MNKIVNLYIIAERHFQKKIEKILFKYKCNLINSFYGKGSAPKEALKVAGFKNVFRVVLIASVVEDEVNNICEELSSQINDKKKTNLIMFTIPYQSLIGSVTYKLLSSEFGG